MMRRFLAVLAAVCLAWSPLVQQPLRAQGESAHAKQELARGKFQELTERMQRLMTVLQSDSPDDAGLLGAGLQFVREAKIHEDLAKIAKLLEQERWDDSLAEMAQVRDDLSRLYELLQNRNLDLRKLLEKIASLEGFRDRVDQLAKDQAEHKEASAKSEALQKRLADIEAQKQRAAALLAQQRNLREQTNGLGLQAQPEPAQKAQKQQAQLQKDTEQLQKDLQELEAKAAAPADGKASKPAEGQASKPAEGKPSESAGQASQSMGKAAESLGEKQTEPALKDQAQAAAALERTVKDLDAMAEEARRELEKLPFDDQAKKQEDTEKATDTLSQDMEKAEKQEGEAGEQTPGRKRVQQAVPKQRAAAGQLKEYKSAKQKQQDAKEDLEAAKKELDDALAQLRQQLQDEVLRALEERFTAMLKKQRDLSAETKTLDGTRKNVLTADGALPTSLAERIAAVASGEGDLEVEAADALKLLAEEGTTAVFPEIIEDLQGQLRSVAADCRGNRTDDGLQQKQSDVEATLELLINALRKTIERKEAGH
jgi:myosin heavy subunit